jgi:hypothetical protein
MKKTKTNQTSNQKGKIILKKEKQTKQNHKKTETNKTKKKVKEKERKHVFSNVVFGQYTLRNTRKTSIRR